MDMLTSRSDSLSNELRKLNWANGLWTRDKLQLSGETSDYINLGKTGPRVSRICLGCMTLEEE